jgi:hypothetical protein
LCLPQIVFESLGWVFILYCSLKMLHSASYA